MHDTFFTNVTVLSLSSNDSISINLKKCMCVCVCMPEYFVNGKSENGLIDW